MGQIMKKSFLLSFCLFGLYGVSACSNLSNNDKQDFYHENNDAPVIETAVNPYDRCGKNGISCNDTALVNYAKTDADFRSHGERTRRDHLYTQSGVGSNLVATIQPGLEDDKVSEVVLIKDTMRPNNPKKYTIEDGVFSETGTLEIEVNSNDYKSQKIAEGKTAVSSTLSRENINKSSDAKNKVGIVSNVKLDTPKTEAKKVIEEDGSIIETKKIAKADGSTGETKKITKKDGTIIRIKKIVEVNGDISEVKKVTDKDGEVKELKKTIDRDGAVYEVVCNEECDDFFDEESEDDKDVVLSEFTEESFDIADYTDEEEVQFENIGQENTKLADIDIKDISISDDTVLTWEAEEGENLRELLTKWSSMAGWKLLWNTNRNYVLSAGVMFKGKFADVSSALIRAFARARPAPIATYYKGNRVIVIETMENENAY